MATKEAPKKKAAAAPAGALMAYNVKEKEMQPMTKVVIDITSNGRYFAKGESKSGSKLCSALSEVNAKAAIKDGKAKKGTGW